MLDEVLDVLLMILAIASHVRLSSCHWFKLLFQVSPMFTRSAFTSVVVGFDWFTRLIVGFGA